MELDLNNIISLNADGDRKTVFRLGVWQGNASMSVWSNNSSVFRTSAPKSLLVLIARTLERCLNNGKPGDKESVTLRQWDKETTKWTVTGTLVIGRDDKSELYFGVMATNHAPMKFPLRTPLSFDTSTPLTDLQRSELAAETMILQLRQDLGTATTITSYKREMQGGRSGNRGGDAGVSVF